MSYSGDDMTDDTADDLPDDALGDVRGGVTNDAGDARNGIPPGAIAAAAMHDWLKDVPGADQDNLAALAAMAPVSAPGVGDADTNLAAAADITPTDVADLTRVSDPLHPDPASEIASAAPVANPPPLPSVDRSFLTQQEGYSTTAYPGRGENSGVTIATGVDLGQHSAGDLHRWGVSDEAIGDLSPYLKGERKTLPEDKNTWPNVSDADAHAMDQGALNDTIRKVQQSYDATHPATKFADLPQEARTAIIDVAYQHGTNMPKKTPDFWGYVTSGDWNGAVGELRDFHDKFGPRRDRDADLMQGAIDRGALFGR